MKIVAFAALFALFGLTKSRAQGITPLHKYSGAYVDSLQENLIVPSLRLRIDNSNQLFYRDSVLFIPKGDFEF